MENIFNSKEYKRSRVGYVSQCTLEYFVSILLTDAFLAKVLSYMGVKDSYIGIIASLGNCAFMFQLLSLWFISKIKSVKKTVIVLDTLSQLLFTVIYLFSIFKLSGTVKTVVAILCPLLAYISQYSISSVYFKWANSFVQPEKRASFSAVKEMISLVTGIGFSLFVGFKLDQFEANGNIEKGFIFVAIMLLILNAANFISLLMIKSSNENTFSQESAKTPFSIVIGKTLGNSDFRNVIIMGCLYGIGRSILVGFLGIYKTKDLLISVGTVQVINMVANLMRIVVSMPLGRYSDKHSFNSGYRLGLILALLSSVCVIFTTKSTWWMIILYSVFYNMSMAGTNQNQSNIVYSYVESDYIVQAMAIKNAITGMIALGASIVGSRILEHIQNNGNTFLGMNIYAQQLLAVISVVFLLSAIIFNKLVVDKQVVLKQ